MKLIIDIPEETKQEFDKTESIALKGAYFDLGGIIGKAIKNGTPLDDVKSELANINTFERAGCWVMEDVFKVLDNIGKAESED